MPSYRSRFLTVMAATEQRMTQLFGDLATALAGDIARQADAAGSVPRSATPAIQRQIGERVQALFLGRNRAGELAPFEVAANGRVIALAPYPAALWAGITAAARLPVEESAGILAKYAPDDVLAVLRQAKGNPFTAAKRRVVETVAELVLTTRSGLVVGTPTGLDLTNLQEIELFRPNVLAAYDPPHLWVDPNGYRLSDRVWNNSQATRQAIDAYVDDSIKKGIGALEMSKGLTQFLTPGQSLVKTNAPYGTTASYGAMRLARTEITRAHSEAQKVSAATNPFIEALKWNLSARHPRIDICDDYARGGPNKDGVYAIADLPSLPHPHCLCFRTNVMVADPDAIVDALRRDIRQARADLVGLIGPAAVEDFDMLLLGGQGPLSAPVGPTVRRVTPPPPRPAPATPAVTPPMAGLDDPAMTLVWGKDPEGQGQQLNGVALAPADGSEYWLGWKDQKFKGEPKLPTGQRISTGVVIVEPDGRIWIVEPAGHYGGYQHTFPKGGLEPNLSAQQNALKELYEESGLTAELTGYLGDFQGSTGVSRYYIAKRTGGAPWRSDWETATVKLAPQDKAEGLLNTKRDKDILAALQAKLTPVPKAKRTRKPATKAAKAGEIPDLDQLAFVKQLGGSTGAQLFEGADGRRYVVKGGNSDEHIRSEYLTDELYRALGANVPKARLVQKDGKTFKIAEFVDGRLLNELSGKELAAAHKKLQKHFAADALLAAWDVIGAGADNIIIDAKGQPWRIDNGGGLLFRAQGAPKPMTSFFDELWSLRDPNINRQTAAVFGDLKYTAVLDQLRAVVAKRGDLMSRITDPAVRRIIDARLNHAEDLFQIYSTLHADGYKDNYIERFSYHNTWVQSTGITSTLPQLLKLIDNPRYDYSGNMYVELEDENGKMFDDLRGKSGIYARFLKELNRRSGDKGGRFIEMWSSAQAGSSWSGASLYAKRVMTKNRPGDYHFNTVSSSTNAEVKNLGRYFTEADVTDATAALNALSYETLRRVAVGNRPAPGLIHLIRTEGTRVMRKYGFEVDQFGQTGTMKRGNMESTSLLRPIAIYGTEITEQDVPLHRVIGFYGFGIDDTIYLNDKENELLTLLDGVNVNYTGTLRK